MPLYAADIFFVGTLYGGCVWDASACRVISAGLTNLNTVRLHRLVTVAAVLPIHSEITNNE
jgi:hypothetical protein